MTLCTHSNTTHLHDYSSLRMAWERALFVRDPFSLVPAIIDSRSKWRRSGVRSEEPLVVAVHRSYNMRNDWCTAHWLLSGLPPFARTLSYTTTTTAEIRAIFSSTTITGAPPQPPAASRCIQQLPVGIIIPIGFVPIGKHSIKTISPYCAPGFRKIRLTFSPWTGIFFGYLWVTAG